ncbi:MAG: energy coupling factor transporter S component ThiW [Bacillota bacterium]|nr:energy coupling factor transporter S component ThiW [Bacillota bacterium]
MKNSLVKTFPLRKIVAVGLLVALGVVAAPLSIPVGVAKVYPIQHAINVLAGAMLGPGPAVMAAILTSTLRNLMGTGTPLAFPGSIFGALLAGLAFRYLKRDYFAAAGEIVGTGLIGGLVAFPLAKWILGFAGLAYAFIIPFALSSLAGSVIGVIILRLWTKTVNRNIH